MISFTFPWGWALAFFWEFVHSLICFPINLAGRYFLLAPPALVKYLFAAKLNALFGAPHRATSMFEAMWTFFAECLPRQRSLRCVVLSVFLVFLARSPCEKEPVLLSNSWYWSTNLFRASRIRFTINLRRAYRFLGYFPFFVQCCSFVGRVLPNVAVRNRVAHRCDGLTLAVFGLCGHHHQASC